MKKYSWLIVFFVLQTTQSCLAQQLVRPNIILFLVDDMGWQDCSVPFSTNAYATPVPMPDEIK